MFSDHLRKTITQSPSLNSLDNTAKSVWKALGEGLINDTEAEALSATIEARREALRGPRAVQTPKTRSRPCVSSDRRKSITRRRSLASSGAVPSSLAHHFTTGELAVLTVIAREVQRKGLCLMFMVQIAAIAGVSRTTAHGAIRQAQALGMLTVTERRISASRNDSNIIRIIHRDWTAWLRLGVGTEKRRPRVTDTDKSYFSAPSKTSAAPQLEQDPALRGKTPTPNPYGRGGRGGR